MQPLLRLQAEIHLGNRRQNLHGAISVRQRSRKVSFLELRRVAVVRGDVAAAELEVDGPVRGVDLPVVEAAVESVDKPGRRTLKTDAGIVPGIELQP